MSNRQFLEECEALRIKILNDEFEQSEVENVIQRLAIIKSRSIHYSPKGIYYIIKILPTIKYDIAGIHGELNFNLKQHKREIVSYIDKIAESGIAKKTMFLEFIDKIANKLSCLGIFNALFIFSSTLDKNFSGKCLVVSFLTLSLLMFGVVISETITKLDRKSFGYVGFMLCMLVSFIALTYYSLNKYPEFLKTTTFIASLFLYGWLLYKFYYRMFSIKFKMSDEKKKKWDWIFRYTVFSDLGNEFGLVLLSVIFSFISLNLFSNLLQSIIK